MSWKSTVRMLALGLVLVAYPAAVFAQGSGDTKTEGEEAEAEKAGETGDETSGSSSESTSSEKTAKTEQNEGDEKETDEGGESSEASKEADEGDSTASKGKDSSEAESAEASGSSAPSKKKEAKTDEEPKVGPGGKKLRSDYPGSEEAMKEQMETDRIEGLQFKEGQEPAQTYDVQIQELETKIDDLKEKVFQSKSRVVLLKETVLGGNLSGSRAMIVHANDLGNQFELRRAMYSLDGNRVFNESKKTGKTVEKKKFKVYDGNISAGTHNVSVLLEYRGNGYGVFNYMKGYNFKITSSCQFKADPGKATVLRVRTVNKAGAFADVEKKPGIKCKIETRDLSKGQGGGEESQSEGASSGSSGT